eukprot:1227740-Rhodomonas_salina.1
MPVSTTSCEQTSGGACLHPARAACAPHRKPAHRDIERRLNCTIVVPHHTTGMRQTSMTSHDRCPSSYDRNASDVDDVARHVGLVGHALHSAPDPLVAQRVHVRRQQLRVPAHSQQRHL